MVAAAVGIAGLFGTLVVAGPVYELIPRPVALFGAFATGAVGVTLAIRWRAQVYGWLGLLGALTAPIALGAIDGGGIVFLAVAFAATIAVLVWQRWTALAVAAFTVTTLQWLGWLLFEGLGDPATIVTLTVFGVLTAALALGFELNRPGLHPVAIGPRARLRPHPFAIVLVISAALLAITGWELLDGEPWLVALAVAHIASASPRRMCAASRARSRSASLAIGIVLADLAFASMASGLPLDDRLGAVGAPVRGAARRPHRAARAASSTASSAGPTARARSASTGSWRSPACSGRWCWPPARRLIFDARPEALAGPAAPTSRR